MDERVVKFRVGVMVLSTVFIAAILLLLFGDAHSLVRGSYAIYMHFTDAPGVTDGTPLRKSGILIGRVTSLRFADQGGVIVEAKIDGNVKLYRNEVPQVSGSLLGGDVVIQFMRGVKAIPSEQPATPPVIPAAERPDPNGKAAAAKAPAESRDVLVQPGEYIEGSVASNAFQVISNLEGDLSTAIGSLATAGAEVGKLAGNLNKILANKDDQFNRIVDKTEQTLDNFQRTLANFEDVLGDQEVRDKLKSAISHLPELLEDTRGAITTIRTTVESVDRNLVNLEGLTGPLGERGEHIVTSVDEAVSRLDELLGEMSDFGRKLNSGEGTIGELMRNPELYQHLNGAVRNVEQITRELKPILADARVFTDKIARHPELLGVRGAIQKSPGTK